LTILHEIAHTLNRLPDDSQSYSQSFANDQAVYEECKKGIDARDYAVGLSV